MVIKYLGPFFKPTCEAIDVGACILIAMSYPYTSIKAYELDTFKPNAYLFENCKDLGANETEIYAEAVR